MLKKTITFTDYNGTTRTEDFWFNLSQAEITDLQLGVHGGFTAMVNKAISTQDTPTLISIFKDMIQMSYGEKSADGRRFIKKDRDGYALVNDFIQTEAYSILYMELATNDKAGAEFINGVIPSDLAEKVAIEMAKEQPRLVN